MKLSCMQEAEKNFVVQSCFQCFNHLWLFTLQTHRRANKLECLLYTVLNFLACCDHSDFVIKCSVLLKRQNAISLMLDLSVLFFFFFWRLCWDTTSAAKFGCWNSLRRHTHSNFMESEKSVQLSVLQKIYLRDNDDKKNIQLFYKIHKINFFILPY